MGEVASDGIFPRVAEQNIVRKYPRIQIVERVIKEVRESPDTPDKWKRLDFLEIYTLSKLSNEAAKREHKTFYKDLPRVRRIRMKTHDLQQEFTALWKDFTSAEANDETDVRQKLERVYTFWQNHSRGFYFRRQKFDIPQQSRL